MFVVLVVDAAGEAREIPAEPRDTVDRGALEASPHPPLEQISVRAAATQLPQEATMQKARRGAALPCIRHHPGREYSSKADTRRRSSGQLARSAEESTSTARDRLALRRRPADPLAPPALLYSSGNRIGTMMRARPFSEQTVDAER